MLLSVTFARRQHLPVPCRGCINGAGPQVRLIQVRLIIEALPAVEARMGGNQELPPLAAVSPSRGAFPHGPLAADFAAFFRNLILAWNI